VKNRITNSEIIEILRSRVPIDKRIAVQQIHNLVKDNYELSDEDLASHPSEIKRGNRYPAWKRKVQALLHTMKINDRIRHFEETEQYEFDLLSFD
jgi:hypothetical protein